MFLRIKRSVEIGPLKWFLIILVAWVWLLHLAQIEGRYFPAAKPMVLIGAFPTAIRDPDDFEWDKIHGGPNTAFWIESERLRPDCSPKRLEWFLGKRKSKRHGAPVRVFWGPPVNRPDNEGFISGPWIARVSLPQFLKSHSDVIHSCRFFGIEREVRTPFWH